MKPNKQAFKKRNMEALNAFVKEAERVSDIRLEFKSDIHIRITIKGKWTDFWPTTGKWYDPTRNGKGTSVETLINILRMKTGTELPMGKFYEKPKPPTVLDRLSIIEEQILAIRNELTAPATVQPILPSFMDDPLNETPYDDSWAKGDPFKKDDDLPPWTT